MPIAKILADFKADVLQCEDLIANVHKTDSSGTPIFSLVHQKQITIAAFLNMFMAWETFLESSLTAFMVGNLTLSGTAPVRYVMPVSLDASRALIIGVQRYFDYGNHDFVRKMVGIYFRGGYPYEPHLSSIHSELADLRTMRNASAHITSTTQVALEALSQRLFAQPHPGIDLYRLLLMVKLNSVPRDTIFLTYKNTLVVTAELIAQG